MANGDSDFTVVDITDPTRALIRHLDGRIDDLSYRPDVVIKKQARWGRRERNGVNVENLTQELRKEKVFPSLGSAEIAAEYLLDVYYPALQRIFHNVGLTAGAIHDVRITMSISRQVHARVLVASAYDNSDR